MPPYLLLRDNSQADRNKAKEQNRVKIICELQFVKVEREEITGPDFIVRWCLSLPIITVLVTLQRISHVQSVMLPLVNDSYKRPSELAASKYYLPFKLGKMSLTAESCNEH